MDGAIVRVRPGLDHFSGSPARADAPLAEKYLLDGKLAEGTEALRARLKESPTDDQARFGLGVVQFLQTFEHLGVGCTNTDCGLKRRSFGQQQR